MPLMNGIQLVSSLRKKDINNKATVIVLCDDLSEKDAEEYSKLGVTKFLPVNSPISEIDNILGEL